MTNHCYLMTEDENTFVDINLISTAVEADLTADPATINGFHHPKWTLHLMSFESSFLVSSVRVWLLRLSSGGGTEARRKRHK